jgi:hypothetical protein
MSNEVDRLKQELHDCRRVLRDCLATCRQETLKLRAERNAAREDAAGLRKRLEAPLRERYRNFATKRLKHDRALLRQRIAAAERRMTAFAEPAWADLMKCIHPDAVPSKETKDRTFKEVMRRERQLRAAS